MTQIALFDYSQLDVEQRIVVQQRTSEIKVLVRRSAQDIVDIGTKLAEVKTHLKHGNFLSWLDSEFQWTSQTAWRFMRVAERFKYNNLLDLNIGASALYLLADSSTPDEIVQETLERAAQGQVISYSTVKQMIDNEAVATAPNGKVTAAHVETVARRYVAPVAPPEPPPVDDDEYLDELAEDEAGYDWTDDEPVQVAPPAKPHIAHNSGNNEWYTPAEYIEAARAVMGDIDLDPATSCKANEVVGAKMFYTAEDDGLTQSWSGRVWMNPPYSSDLIKRFAEKMAFHYEQGDISEAIILVNNATETGWFQTLIKNASAVNFPGGRVRFWQPLGDKGAPLQGQAIIYLGDNPQTFGTEFSGFGWCAFL